MSLSSNLQDIRNAVKGLDSQATAYDKDRLKMLVGAIDDLRLRLGRIERHLDINRVPSIAGPKLASIPELLEPILLHLPTRDLLLSQRVSKTFKAVIDSSSAIQRALFMEPEPAPASFSSIDVRINPLLTDTKSYIRIPLYAKHNNFGYNAIFLKGAGWNMHKLRVVDCEVYESVSRNVSDYGRQWVSLSLIFGRLSGTVCYGRADDVGTSVNGSWRKMSLTQPPIRPIFYFEHNRGSGSGTPLDISSPFRFGQLLPWMVYASDGTEVDAPNEEEE